MERGEAMSDEKKPDALERLVKGYETMLERANEAIDTTEKRTLPLLRDAMMGAREKAVELGELTREEAEKVSRYVERDIHDAAEFLVDTGQEFRDWLSFDWQLLNERMLDAFASMADQTSIALRDLAERAQQATIYHTGEIAGPGPLVCTSCGYVIQSKAARPIPPCPNCQHKEFRRARGSDGAPDQDIDQGDVDGD